LERFAAAVKNEKEFFDKLEDYIAVEEDRLQQLKE